MRATDGKTFGVNVSKTVESGGARRHWLPLTDKRFDAAVDVLVLLEARRGGEGLATLGTRVSASAHVLGADVALEVAGICEHLEFGRSTW